MSDAHIIHSRNVNHALSDAVWWLHVAGSTEQSRNGEVLVAPGPVLTEYQDPTERVLFSEVRDANPYFHLMEALWMLAGHNDVEFPAQFSSNIVNYSDDGKSFWGAYGWRWRCKFGYDQLAPIVAELKKNPDSRRCVLAMWDGAADLHQAVSGGADVPCNTHAYFDCRTGVLNMTVLNRSNDAIWGCYGANAVHFSILQEYLATRIGVPTGVYNQMSNNLHIYKSVASYDRIVPGVDVLDLYSSGEVSPYPLMQTDDESWMHDLVRFLEDPCGDTAYADPFFNDVAAPMAASWFDRKAGRNSGHAAAQAIAASDWRQACLMWLDRREEAKKGMEVCK